MKFPAKAASKPQLHPVSSGVTSLFTMFPGVCSGSRPISTMHVMCETNVSVFNPSTPYGVLIEGTSPFGAALKGAPLELPLKVWDLTSQDQSRSHHQCPSRAQFLVK